MKNIFSLAICLFLTLFIARSQTSIGLGAGINLPIISSSQFGNLVRYDSCNCNQTSSKNEVTISPLAYVELTHNIGSYLGLPTSLHLNVGYLRNSWNEDTPIEKVKSRFGYDSNTMIYYKTENSLDILNTNLGVLLTVPEIKVDLSVSINLSTVVNSNTFLTHNIALDQSFPIQFTPTSDELAASKLVYGFPAYYLDDSRTTIVLYNKEAPEINTFRVGFSLGLRKEFTVFDIPIIPSISYQYLPQMISKYESASIHNLSIGLGTKILL